MSDYSAYSEGDDYDNSFEENYAGAYGGYDDMYDDVMEEAGYDAWGIYDGEFGFDGETFLFEFDPFREYFELRDDSGVVIMTYQSLYQLTKMTRHLLGAWLKRSVGVTVTNVEDVQVEDEDNQPLGYLNRFGQNLYRLDLNERKDLRAYSVDKVKRLFGEEEDVIIFKEEVAEIVKFLNQCLLNVLGQCLPLSLPYPALSCLLSYLLAVDGLEKLGMVNNEEVEKDIEKQCMDNLYHGLADVYDHLKVVMFNIEPNTHNTDPSFREKRSNLSRRFKQLVDVVGSGSIEDGLFLEALNIHGDKSIGEKSDKST